MTEARSEKNPLKSSLVSQFLLRIKVELYTYPAIVIPTRLQPYHVCLKDFLSNLFSSLPKFRKMLVPTTMDVLNVPNARWISKVTLTRVVSGQLSTSKPICSRGPLVSFLSRPSRVHCFYLPIKITTGHVDINKIYKSLYLSANVFSAEHMNMLDMLLTIWWVSNNEIREIGWNQKQEFSLSSCPSPNTC